MNEAIFIKDEDQQMCDHLQGVDSPMRNFFRGKTVLLTGGTGFLGKLFIEKLLRCEVREIILLVRGKRGRTPKERLQRQLEREAIYVSYSKNPEFYWSKLRIVEGSLEHEEIGLSNDDLDYLKSNVDIVIHSAADVRFDVSLKVTIRTNVFGGNELLKLALEMKKLSSFLYVSTAYSNCSHAEVEERFYDDLNVDPMEMVRLMEAVGEDEVNSLCHKIIHPWPNTYTYAKALAESLVRQYCDRLPVAVIRPPVVISTFSDPIEGWTDNVYGLNGVLVGVGSGVLRVLHCNNNYHIDIIPADLVVNSSLAVIWYTATRTDPPTSELEDNERVFNCTTRSERPFSYEDVHRNGNLHKDTFPPLQSLWYSTYSSIQSGWVYYVLQLLYHFIPAVLFDTIAELKGMEPRVLSIYRKINAFSDVIEFFTTNQWTFVNSRMRHVYDCVSQADQKFFVMDIKTVQWDEFFPTYLLGLRTYILKESLDNVEQAKIKYRRLRIAHYVVLGLFYALLTYVGFVLLNKTSLRHGFATVGSFVDSYVN